MSHLPLKNSLPDLLRAIRSENATTSGGRDQKANKTATRSKTTTIEKETMGMARLTGMKEICTYEKKSEATILDLIRNYGYPAVKIRGKIWESDTDLIEKWRIQIIGDRLRGRTWKKMK